MERVIPLFILKISRGEQIVVYGQDKVLDFTYIDDCVRGVLKGIDLILSDRHINQTINLAYGQGNSLITMAKFIGEELGSKADIQVEPPRVGEVTYYVANIGKARAILDYLPETSLIEGIAKAVAWNLDWWSTHPPKTT